MATAFVNDVQAHRPLRIGQEQQLVSIALCIGNMAHIAKIYGRPVSQSVAEILRARVIRCVGATASVVAAGSDALIVTPRREVSSNLHENLAAALNVISAPIFLSELGLQDDRGDAGAIVAIVGARTFSAEDDLPAFGANVLADWQRLIPPVQSTEHWQQQYCADMTVAAWFWNAKQTGDAFVRWQPVVSSEAEGEVLYWEAIPTVASEHAGDGRSRDDQNVRSADFLASALRRLGLSSALELWVANAVVDELAARSDVRLACNFTPCGMAESLAWDELIARLSDERQIAHRLVVEISDVDACIEVALPLTKRLRDLGCTIALDNFGAGQSAVRGVVALNPEIVKFDASFARIASSDKMRWQLYAELKNLLEIAKRRGLTVVVLGVDAHSLVTVVTLVGSEWMQGDWVARPRLSRPDTQPKKPSEDKQNDGSRALPARSVTDIATWLEMSIFPVRRARHAAAVQGRKTDPLYFAILASAVICGAIILFLRQRALWV